MSLLCRQELLHAEGGAGLRVPAKNLSHLGRWDEKFSRPALFEAGDQYYTQQSRNLDNKGAFSHESRCTLHGRQPLIAIRPSFFIAETIEPCGDAGLQRRT